MAPPISPDFQAIGPLLPLKSVNIGTVLHFPRYDPSYRTASWDAGLKTDLDTC